VYTINDLLKDSATAQAGLSNLKDCFAVFINNTQDFPLVHETAWGGIVSSASYSTGDSGADFGNTYYNDHHFHYGYFIYAASIIGYLDPDWLTTNKAYINALARDVANPSTLDTYFPVSRNFDWYNGHSWAHGLYETFDGKDEESSSEDSMHAYALKMWGRTIGDANLEARGNLQLAVTARALQNYFLYTSGNTIEPAQFIGNKVSGILFENKIDHTTYFGTNIEYIQGIHMIPLLPSSTLTRTTEFVSEEWATYFDNGRVDAIVGGWKGILYANYAIIDPDTSYNFFAQSGFDASWLDGGASRTWYMAFAAGLSPTLSSRSNTEGLSTVTAQKRYHGNHGIPLDTKPGVAAPPIDYSTKPKREEPSWQGEPQQHANHGAPADVHPPPQVAGGPAQGGTLDFKERKRDRLVRQIGEWLK
jgi:endo-1,3(4)-beta-glucanase